jgi:SAM-dependent methyltransferase
MSEHARERSDTYLLDPENTAEMTRLSIQDRLVTKSMGGTFSEQENQLPPDIKRVLDVGCGPGGWVMDVAYEYPDVQVVGLDISTKMIAYAKARAQAEGRTNTGFLIADATKPLPFPDGFFDLVNGRYMVGFIRRDLWPSVIQEFARVTRPGGFIRLSEPHDVGATSSPTLKKFLTWLYMGMYKLGYAFSTTGTDVGITPWLSEFLDSVGVLDINIRPSVLDFSYGTEAHLPQCENLTAAFQTTKPLVMGLGVSEAEWRAVTEQAKQEMYAADFKGLWYMLTAWGRKPL